MTGSRFYFQFSCYWKWYRGGNRMIFKFKVMPFFSMYCKIVSPCQSVCLSVYITHNTFSNANRWMVLEQYCSHIKGNGSVKGGGAVVTYKTQIFLILLRSFILTFNMRDRLEFINAEVSSLSRCSLYVFISRLWTFSEVSIYHPFDSSKAVTIPHLPIVLIVKGQFQRWRFVWIRRFTSN